MDAAWQSPAAPLLPATCCYGEGHPRGLWFPPSQPHLSVRTHAPVPLLTGILVYAPHDSPGPGSPQALRCPGTALGPLEVTVSHCLGLLAPTRLGAPARVSQGGIPPRVILSRARSKSQALSLTQTLHRKGKCSPGGSSHRPDRDYSLHLGMSKREGAAFPGRENLQVRVQKPQCASVNTQQGRGGAAEMGHVREPSLALATHRTKVAQRIQRDLKL